MGDGDLKWYQSRRLLALVPPGPNLKMGFNHEAGAQCVITGGQHLMRGTGAISPCGAPQSGDSLCLGACLLPLGAELGSDGVSRELLRV